jgi:hypothetical protein
MLGGLPRTRGVFKKTLSGILASKDNDAALRRGDPALTDLHTHGGHLLVLRVWEHSSA